MGDRTVKLLTHKQVESFTDIAIRLAEIIEKDLFCKSIVHYNGKFVKGLIGVTCAVDIDKSKESKLLFVP